MELHPGAGFTGEAGDRQSGAGATDTTGTSGSSLGRGASSQGGTDTAGGSGNTRGSGSAGRVGGTQDSLAVSSNPRPISAPEQSGFEFDIHFATGPQKL